ncbi:MAG: chromosome segregation protein SMC [Synergistaceae bacterium]|nr:chromosome segregation protein SMC [Synergistaceae bacterium]
MYIGRLQLKGFKSFGGSHDLILSSGFTAIVGPNGSGKSNLLDALRWSLGDSSAARLRISRQSDLLFQGSAGKEGAKEAEVTLHLREDDRLCSIKRRVTAPDGVTSLFVDNARKTLSELDEIKRSWKLEGARFAFIGQGEVQEALKQSPAERRMHLEVLFGIDVYRKKRMEAQERLKTVMEEYDQLRHLMGELSSRREEIAPEAARAQQMRVILDSIEKDRRLLYWLRRADCESALARIAEELAAAASLREGRAFWSRFWKSAGDAAEQRLTQAAQSNRQQSWELEQSRSRFDGLIKSGYASAANLRASKARLSEARADCEAAKEHYAKLLEEQKKTTAENKKAREEVEKAQRALEAVDKKWKEYNERMEKTRLERESWNREKGRLDTELQKSRAKLSFLGKDLLELRNKKDAAPDERKDLDRQIRLLEAERDKQNGEQEKLVKEHGELYALCQKLAAELQRAKREAVQLRSRLNDAAESLQAGLYPAPVKHLLSAAKLKRLDADPRAVIDVFTAPAGLSAALEAYLGGRQFQLLVENMEEAGRCIDRLKQNSAGVASFLPLERARPRFPNRAFRLPPRGVVGWAIELIKVEEHWLPAIQHIMGDLLVVDSYNVGKELVRGGFKGPVVTTEGDVFQPGGAVSGGRSQKSGRVLEMKAQIAKLEEESAAATAAAETLSKKFKEAERREIEVSEEKEEYTRKIRELNGRIAIIEDQKEAAAKELRRAAGERGRILESIAAEGKNWAALLKAIDELEEKRDNASDVEDDHKLIEERESCRARASVAAGSLSSGFALMERVRNEVKAQENKLRRLEEEISDLDQSCVKERANLARIGGSCLEIHLRRKEIIAQMEEGGALYSALEKLRGYIAARRGEAEERLRGEAEKLSLAQAKKSEYERELAELINSWEEQYHYPGAEELPKDINLEELRKKIRDGDRKIKAFGEVNMGVLSEDQSLRERLAFLGAQLDDVRASASEIQRLISEADAMAHKQFASALLRVDERFCELFKKLFGGGEAHLVMTEGETIWNIGVEIEARLPGKHTQVLNQYSGGERSLISISLLFATMEVAGSPIAVLDEVDAALDEANLRRFSELTREYAKSRQILAMTHRRATMERADVLYGVTLQEPGLSQVVGVRLDDWT